jgi:hypothetical protein
LTVTPGAGQTGDPFDVGTFFQVSQYGNVTISGKVQSYDNIGSASFTFPVTVVDTASITTARTAGHGPVTIASSRQYGPGGTYQLFEISCYMNVQVAAASTSATLTLNWTDNVGAKASAGYVLSTTSTTNSLSIGPIPVVASANGTSTNVTYTVTTSGTGQTYGDTCVAKAID